LNLSDCENAFAVTTNRASTAMPSLIQLPRWLILQNVKMIMTRKLVYKEGCQNEWAKLRQERHLGSRESMHAPTELRRSDTVPLPGAREVYAGIATNMSHLTVL